MVDRSDVVGAATSMVPGDYALGGGPPKGRNATADGTFVTPGDPPASRVVDGGPRPVGWRVMAPSDVATPSPRRLSPERYRWITGAALAALCFIVLTGAAVRLTGSGLGCPTWPNCDPGSLAPKDATSFHAMVEFLNRLITGLVSVAVILAVAGSRFRQPRRRDLTVWSWTLVAGVVAQVVLGGITVLTHLSPPIVAGHYLLSAVLVGCAVVLHHRAGEPDAGVRRPTASAAIRQRLIGAVALIGAVLVTGTAVTGAGPHGGDADVERLDIAITDVARIHSVTAWVYLALVVAIWVRARREAATTVEARLREVIAVAVGQGAVGYLQYFTGIPEGLVLVHIAGSMLVLAATIRALLATSEIAPVLDPSASPAAAEAVA